MNKEEFLNLVWRLEEILKPLDDLRAQVGNCGGRCKGYDLTGNENLCPACAEVHAKLAAEEERLGKDQELNALLKTLKTACDDDKTGTYERMLKQAREGKIGNN